jgi:hypothetical protein
VIRAVEWFVPNTPKRLHVWEAFIRPEDLRAHCEAAGLSAFEARAFEPRIRMRDVASILLRRRVPADFVFTFTNSPVRTGYAGLAVRSGPAARPPA